MVLYYFFIYGKFLESCIVGEQVCVRLIFKTKTNEYKTWIRKVVQLSVTQRCIYKDIVLNLFDSLLSLLKWKDRVNKIIEWCPCSRQSSAKPDSKANTKKIVFFNPKFRGEENILV